jgi:hypothetical protein
MARSARNRIVKAEHKTGTRTLESFPPAGAVRSATPNVALGRGRLGLLPRVAGVVAVLALLVFGLVMLWPWTGNAEAPADKRPRGDAFAADRDVPPGGGAGKAVAFDAKRAMGYLEAVCKIGPRISGTAGMTRQQELLEKHFKAHGGTITWQRFTAKQVSVRKPVPMANLVVSWWPERPRRVVLCSHYDTRPIADQEPNRRRWREPFVSANDGGSGVALLMELAHHLKGLETKVGVDFVFFDGEEYIWEPDRDEYFFGSKHFAAEHVKERRKTKKRYAGAVLLDMVGGKNARFPIEQNSWSYAAPLVREVWAIAAEQKCAAFTEGFSKDAVLDDHVPLNKAGIPAVDIIDFSYPHWHRLTDVPGNCSGETLAQVARVVGLWVQRAK